MFDCGGEVLYFFLNVFDCVHAVVSLVICCLIVPVMSYMSCLMV